MCYKNLFLEQTTAPPSANGSAPPATASDMPFFYNEADFFGNYDFPTVPSTPLTHIEEQNTSPMSLVSDYSPPAGPNGYDLTNAAYPQCYSSRAKESAGPTSFARPVYNGFVNPPEYAYNPSSTHLPSFVQIMQGLDMTQEQYSPDSDMKFTVPPSTSPLQQQTMCKVCCDVASGNHFGVLSCEACKSFFRRSVRAGARYACRGSRNCSVEKHTRNRCQYCRLQKCAQMGMRKEAVQEERAPPVTKLQRAGTPTQLGYTQLPMQQLPMPSTFRSYDSPVSPVVPAGFINQSRMFGSLPNLKMGLDLELQQPLTPPIHIPSMDSYSSQPPTPNSGVSSIPTYPNMYPTAPPPMQSTHVSASVLVNADLHTDVPPESVTTTDKGVKLEDIFEGARQSLLRVIEWGKRIPAFTTLGLDDQVKLLKSCWCEHVLLKLATRIGPHSETLLLSSGITCRKEQIEDPEVRRIVEHVSHEISYWFDVLSVDRVEMACLKGIILFNPDARGLSAGVRKRVEIFQEQILQALETRCKTVYPVTPLRFSKLILRLPPLRAASLEATQHMEVQRTLGNTKMDNIFGELLDFD